ncbi:MAG: hypothetical protein QM682_15305 [Paracoccus sp. (in: a-proteobacteria)]
MLRIGFFIPEFPGQTHIFLWRERQALAELGAEAEPISTRPPPRKVASHSWTAEARERTRYLTPVGAAGLAGAAAEMLRNPSGTLRGLRAAMQAEASGGAKARLRILGLLAMGARLKRIARKEGWGHIHVHSCADSLNIAMLAERLGGPSYSLTLHGPTLEGYGVNQRQKWRHARFATIISRLLTSLARREIGDDLPGFVNLAPMGVELSQIRRASPWQPPQPGGPARIFSCGRLNAIKGHDHLIRSVEFLRAQGIDAQPEIAGLVADPARALALAQASRARTTQELHHRRSAAAPRRRPRGRHAPCPAPPRRCAEADPDRPPPAMTRETSNVPGL